MFHERTNLAAKGKWKGILLQLGVPAESLTGKHGPCPMCGGSDRFRFDNKDQRGTWICNACGAGDGMKLAIDYTGRQFAEIASEIDLMLGNIKPDGSPKPPLSEDERKRALRAVVAATRPVINGDLAHRYLEARGVAEMIYPKALRFGASIADGEGGVRPCMVAVVQAPDGSNVTLHRTFLRPDGLAKAEMASPRKLMPGDLPDGACVRLSDWTGAGAIGVAEGIETAMAASSLYGLPVWAAINTAMMAKWKPPQGAEEVAIFADNDAKFGGQAAAFTLAHRIATHRDYAGIRVSVHVPDLPGADFNDILLGKRP